MNRAQSELAAMQAVAAALSSLPDGDSRNRVMRWAAEHFSAELVPSVVTSMALSAGPSAQALAPAAMDRVLASDPENLDSLFEEASAPKIGVNPVERGEKTSVVSTIHSFVTDFQKLAKDWQNA